MSGFKPKWAISSEHHRAPLDPDFHAGRGGGIMVASMGADNRGGVRAPMSPQFSVLRRGMFASRRGKLGTINRTYGPFSFCMSLSNRIMDRNNGKF